MKLSEKQKNLIITMCAGKIKDTIWDIKYHSKQEGMEEENKFHKMESERYEELMRDYVDLIEFVIKDEGSF